MTQPTKTLLALTTLLIAAVGASQKSLAQGCVAVRCGTLALGAGGNNYLNKNQWQASLGYRWLHSDRHFVGRTEQKHRQARGDEVINDSHTFDLGASYGVTKQLAATLTVPFVYSDRTSWYEHDRTRRYHMEAGGLGDIRLTGDYWLFDTEKNPNGNVSIGAGVKFPTGDDNATDIAYRTNGLGQIVPTERPVDQSIQPGDGGWGIILQGAGFLKLVKNLYGYANATYIFLPENTSDTETTTSRPFNNPTRITYLSISDSYLGRIGLSYAIWPEKGLALSVGPRIEGVPADDAIGDSDGFRRPGYVISIEPGLSYTHKDFTAGVTVPVALVRDRIRSVADRASGGHGDAAFADYTVNLSFAYRF